MLKKIAIGSDQKRSCAREQVMRYLKDSGFLCRDFGGRADYSKVAQNVSEAVACGSYDTGILICRNGIGMSIAANKLPSIRAARCVNVQDAYDGRYVNDANILALGDMDEELTCQIVSVWLGTKFAGESRYCRSLKTIEGMDAIRVQHG